MLSGEPRLSIGYGADSTRAVLVFPDGRWQPLMVEENSLVLSSAVHSTARLVGQTAWRHATSFPDGFIPSPVRHPAGHDDPATGQWAAATLSRVAAVATQVAGRPVADVRMVVPADWGPRRRTWLRQSAVRAGLGQPRLVQAPVAAANRLLVVGVPVPVGGFLLIGDLGAGCEMSVLRRDPHGFEVLSTLTDAHAGGWAADDRLMATLTTDPDGAGRWTIRQWVSTAREQLSQHSVVSVPMPPPAPPVLLHAQVVNELTAPVWKQAADLAHQAVTAADLTPAQLSGAYLIGAAAGTPAAARTIGEVLGVAVHAVNEPGMAAVLGAADADTHPQAATPPRAAVKLPPFRRLAGMLLPGVASLALFFHMVFTAEFNNGTPDRQRYGYYVSTTWGELTVAAVFLLITTVSAGSLFGAALAHALHRDGARPLPQHEDGGAGQVAGGITMAVVTALAVAAAYGVAAAAFFGLPATSMLRWTIWPLLPAAAIAGTLAWLTTRRPNAPSRGWDQLLIFPTSSVACTATGMIMLAGWWSGPLPARLTGFGDLIGRTGGILIGLGIAFTVVRHPILRAGLGLVAAVFGMLIIGANGHSILAVAYATAVTAWFAYRLWLVWRLPVPTHHAP